MYMYIYIYIGANQFPVHHQAMMMADWQPDGAGEKVRLAVASSVLKLLTMASFWAALSGLDILSSPADCHTALTKHASQVKEAKQALKAFKDLTDHALIKSTFNQTYESVTTWIAKCDVDLEAAISAAIQSYRNDLSKMSDDMTAALADFCDESVHAKADSVKELAASVGESLSLVENNWKNWGMADSELAITIPEHKDLQSIKNKQHCKTVIWGLAQLLVSKYLNKRGAS